MGPLTTWQLPGPTLLFCPGDRPERFDKALDRADAVILDLEDAVPAERKDTARTAVVDALRDGLDPDRTLVRVNAAGSPWARDDVAALDDTPLRAVMLSKAEPSSVDIDAHRWQFVALVETPLGIVRAAEVAAAPGCVGVAWGGQDLATSLGAPPLDGHDALHETGRHARMVVRFAAAARGLPAVDTVRTRIDDDEGLTHEAAQAAQAGFAAKLVVHPRQVDIVRRAFRPTDHEVARARRIVDATIDGVGMLDGEMLDAPVIAHARTVLRRARTTAATAP